MRFADMIRAAAVIAAGFALYGTASAGVTLAADDMDIETARLRLQIPADGTGTVGWFGAAGGQGNVAAGDGMFQEGFGIGSFYVPNRRLNARLEILEDVRDRPAFQYRYDCDGPNIRGLQVTRLMEVMPDEASVRVRWTVENKGDEDHWIAPWVRNDVAPGGTLDPQDRVDVPSLEGIRAARSSGYFPAARNWIAATDPRRKETVYAVFNAETLHSFLALRDEDDPFCGFQAAFVPRLLQRGASWQTEYRVNMARGLTRVDFATAELAAQLDYADGSLALLIAACKDMPTLVIRASVLAPNGRVWRLEPKRFTARPDTLIRCTFDWEAPFDGSFEFLALLFDGETPYPLGQGLAPPHEGIDTQFVVGSPDSVSFEAWTDAPHALDRGARTLRRTPAVAGDLAVWFESPLEKVFREDRIEPAGPPDPVVRIGLARNERESFQVVLRPPEGQDLPLVNFVARDLVNPASGARIAAEHLRPHRVEYCPVRVPSYFEGPTGLWPDALPPLDPFTAEGGTANAVWFTLHAPPGTPPGTYRGMIEMVSTRPEPLEIWLEATVYDFELPQSPALKTDFGFWKEAALETCRRAGYTGTPEALARAYARNAAEHRVTLREIAQLPVESADYATALLRFEERMGELPGSGMTSVSAPASLLDVPDQLRMADAFVARHGLEQRVFCHIGDDPPPPAWPRLFERAQQWRAAAPHVPLMVTTFGLQPFLSDAIDIWAVHAPMFDTANNRVLLERVAAGGEVWWYVNHSPSRPYGNFFVDFAGIEHRILFWQAWALGLRGFHHWGINALGPDHDPRDGLTDITPVNGDGFLVYPGASGPVSSIRWETIRDGIEDFDYLVLFRAALQAARERGVSAALLQRAEQTANLEALVPNLVGFTRDPAVLEAKRDALARMIVELNNAR